MGYKLDLYTITAVSNQLRKSRKDVIFTHGTFDLFHVGHSYLLNEAKKKGDVIVVGVESDNNISKYKYKKAPIISEQRRAELVANHHAVDFVFINSQLPENKRYQEEFYSDLYKMINPKYVSYGRNFEYKDNLRKRVNGIRGVGMREVKEYVEYKESSTDIIERIKNY